MKTRIPAVFEKKTKIAKMPINKVIFTVLTWNSFVCFLLSRFIGIHDQRYSRNSTGKTLAPLNYVGMWFIDFWLLLVKCFIHEIWAKADSVVKMFSPVYSSEMSN